MIWFFLACMHTPPAPPVNQIPQVQLERREFTDPAGQYCAWEAESLMFGSKALWTEEAPDAPNGCVPPGEHARTVDVVGQNGKYVSAILRDWTCCPDVVSLRCVTYDGETGEPTTLEAYDEKHALKRQLRAQKEWVRMGAPAGWTLDPNSFLIDGGHVTFCAIQGENLKKIPVR